MTTKHNRRALLTGVAVVAAGGAVVACSTQQADDTVKKIAEIIQQVQKGVKDACTTAGVLVPTANSVLAVLAAIVGAANPALMTAAVIAQAVQQIIGLACPPTTPQGPRPRAGAVNGVTVEFY